jgi:hypothetical protein
VVVLKRAGVTAYEEVSEEFLERCRVAARVVSFGETGLSAKDARIDPRSLVVTIGQEALDAVAKFNAQVIPTLAFHMPSGVPGPPASASPDLVLVALVRARPAVHSVGTIFGPRGEELMKTAERAANQLGIRLVTMRVTNGPHAVRAMRSLSGQVDALWLPGDPDVVTPQVFQYALRLQLERGMPVAAATRQQVHSGALLAVDFSPRAAGRAAAERVNQLLEGEAPHPEDKLDLQGGARITVNGAVGRRLHIDDDALAALGARFE